MCSSVATVESYEGTLVRSRAVLGAGTILTRSTPVYDLVRGEIHRGSADKSLEIPENAVVVPGSRAVTKGKAAQLKVSLYTPVIVKYRDEEDGTRNRARRLAAVNRNHIYQRKPR